MLDVLLFLDFLLPGLIRLRRISVSRKIRESFPDNEFIMCNMCLLVPAALLKTLITVADQIAAAVQSSPGPGNPCSTLFRSLIIAFQLPFFDFASACPNCICCHHCSGLSCWSLDNQDDGLHFQCDVSAVHSISIYGDSHLS